MRESLPKKPVKELPLLPENHEEREHRRREEFLRWILETYHPQKVYYPGSGKDKVPKLVFGEGRVIHVSLRRDHPNPKFYFDRLGHGKKVYTDFRISSFKLQT